MLKLNRDSANGHKVHSFCQHSSTLGLNFHNVFFRGKALLTKCLSKGFTIGNNWQEAVAEKP